MFEKLLPFLLFVAAVTSGIAQENPEEGKKPEPAYVRIINASTVQMKEPWKAGMDLSFKDQTLAIDMRGGEAATYKKISFTGKDTVDVKPTGQKTIIGSVPAKFDKGAWYSIYVTGLADDKGFKVEPMVVRDFPVPEEKLRKGSSRLGVFNAVSTFPVKLQVDGGKPTALPAMSFTELYLPPGSHPYSLIFPYKTSEREMKGFFIVTGDGEYNAVVFASPEKPDRPALRFLENSTAMNDVLEGEKAAEEEKKKQAAAAAAAPSPSPQP